MPDLTITLRNEFLAERELAREVKETDIVLAPYQDSVGSSGCILWAVAFRKKVITQEYGYLGQFVRDHKLGATLDCKSPLRLVQAFTNVLDGAFVWTQKDEKRREALIQSRSKEKFAQALFARWSGQT